LKVDEKYKAESQVEVKKTVEAPKDVKKHGFTEGAFKSQVEIKKTVEPPKQVGKLNVEEKFKPVSQVEIKKNSGSSKSGK